MTTAPRCWLADDGKHFWFQHECEPYDEQLLAKLEPDTAAWYRKQRAAPHMLPIGPAGWEIQTTEQLTITPSIQCGVCGLHGWWRDGHWVPA